MCVSAHTHKLTYTNTHIKAPMRFDSQQVLFIFVFVYVFSELYVHMDKILSEIHSSKFYK